MRGDRQQQGAIGREAQRRVARSRSSAPLVGARSRQQDRHAADVHGLYPAGLLQRVASEEIRSPTATCRRSICSMPSRTGRKRRRTSCSRNATANLQTPFRNTMKDSGASFDVLSDTAQPTRSIRWSFRRACRLASSRAFPPSCRSRRYRRPRRATTAASVSRTRLTEDPATGRDQCPDLAARAGLANDIGLGLGAAQAARRAVMSNLGAVEPAHADVEGRPCSYIGGARLQPRSGKPLSDNRSSGHQPDRYRRRPR